LRRSIAADGALSPIQAAKSRPDWNALASATVAVMALALKNPIPGIVATQVDPSHRLFHKSRFPCNV
jgi:hypothetical protein